MTEIKSNADIEPCLCVVMPAFNEVTTVVEIIKKVLAQRPVQQLIVIDDASTDGTREQLQALALAEPRMVLLVHPSNRGKGASLRTGFAQVTSPIVIVQ